MKAKSRFTPGEPDIGDLRVREGRAGEDRKRPGTRSQAATMPVEDLAQASWHPLSHLMGTGDHAPFPALPEPGGVTACDHLPLRAGRTHGITAWRLPEPTARAVVPHPVPKEEGTR